MPRSSPGFSRSRRTEVWQRFARKWATSVIKNNHLVANCLIYHNVCSLTSIVRELQKVEKKVKRFPTMRCCRPGSAILRLVTRMLV